MTTKNIYFAFIIFITTPILPYIHHAISYNVNCEEFGDNLLMYSHARYLNHLTNIPLLYRPWKHSNLLNIGHNALLYDNYISQYSATLHIHSHDTLLEFFQRIRNPDSQPTLFIVDYLTSDITEWEQRDSQYELLFTVDWQDNTFKDVLKKSLTPAIPIPDYTKPDRLNIAIFINLSNENNPNFSLQYPHWNFTHQIQRIYEWNLERPLYIHLFSNRQFTQEFFDNFCQGFQGKNILFETHDFDETSSSDVIKNFFAIHYFNVLITSRSNFPMMSYHLGQFDMVIYPAHCHQQDQYPQCWVDCVQIISNKSSWFPYSLNTILKDYK